MTSHTSTPLAAIAIRQVEKNTGASRVALGQIEALRQLGYQVVILAEKGDAQRVAQAGAQLKKLWRWPFKGAFRRFWFNRRVQAWCQRHHPQLLVSHGDVVSPDVVFLHNCVHLAQSRIHGTSLPPHHEVAAMHDFILNSHNQAFIAVNSKMMGEELQQRYKIPAARIKVNYPGYDAGQFNLEIAQQLRDPQRERLGLSSDQQLVGLVTSGNFKKRNVDGFIRIAAEVLQQAENADKLKFLVVGKDDMAPYQQQCEEAGLQQHFIWLTPQQEVEALYAALDLFVLPAHIEEFGCVALEAMACGTPVLLSRWVGASEILKDHDETLILPDNDVHQWALRINEMLNTPTLAAKGRDLATLATQYSHQRQYDKLKALFQSIIDH